MKIEKFEDLIAWQKAKELTEKLYTVCKESKEYSLKDLVFKKGIEMMNQLAEGFEKRVHKEMRPSFLVAKGISSQMRSMLYVLLERGCITQDEFKEYYDITWHITKTIMAFIKTMKTEPVTTTS